MGANAAAAVTDGVDNALAGPVVAVAWAAGVELAPAFPPELLQPARTLITATPIAAPARPVRLARLATRPWPVTGPPPRCWPIGPPPWSPLPISGFPG